MNESTVETTAQDSIQSSTEPGYDNIHKWEYHPGGCVVNGATANASFQLNGSDYQPRLTTAGHVTSGQGSKWGNPAKSDPDGTVTKFYHDFDGDRDGDGTKEWRDYALLKEPNIKIREGIRTQDGTDTTQIGGTITNAELDHEGWGDSKNAIHPYSFQGKMTGRTGPNALKKEGIQMHDGDGIQHNAVVVHDWRDTDLPQSGDSGGIYFWLDDSGQAWIIGIHHDRKYGVNHSLGNTAEAMEKGLGGYFA